MSTTAVAMLRSYLKTPCRRYSPPESRGLEASMARRRTVAPLPTIWRVSDELWARIEPILADLDPPLPTGRKRIDQRKALDGGIYHLRTGCQWNALPREFGDDSSVHRTFQRW